ncbi:MAG: sigma 54-interacting transcriptional regulator [Rhodothermia bacterium]|nr:sigma 54-interacting transcriptional regulator [Rhodothermia bacterium]
MTTAAEHGTILIVDDTPANISVLLEYLSQQGFEILVARDGIRALEQVRHARPDLVLLDVQMPGIDGFETCDRLKSNVETRDIPVIFMTALSDTSDKMRGFDSGAVDYVTKPFQHEEVLARITTHLTLRRLQVELHDANQSLEERVAERTSELRQANQSLQAEIAERERAETALLEAVEELERLKNRLEAENVYLQEEIKLHHNFEEIIGGSREMKQMFRKIEQVAGTDATVLILGETGTGKELVARAIHNLSPRKSRPLVKINCAALPDNLVESELFGHEKGAFTGASARKPGRFELANGGTIFLDEVGDLPLALQAKLLRVLQEGELERIGGTETLRVDVRVIAATNRNLDESITEKTFREDLYYRLNVFPLTAPPLRQRSGDLQMLVQHFVQKYCRKLGKSVTRVPRTVMDALHVYDWPGNVRELENVIERAVILSSGDALSIEDSLGRRKSGKTATAPTSLEDVERQHIIKTLEETHWRVEGARGAAKRLDINPSTLRSRMRRLGIEKP